MLRRSLILSFLAFLAISTIAQVQISEECQLKLQDIVQSGSNDEVALLAQVNEKYSLNALKDQDIKVGSHIGSIITIRTSKSSIPFLMHYEGFDLIQVANAVLPEMNRTTPDMRVDSVRTSAQLDLPYSGKDVIIGITDWGFDYTHPNFYDTALQHTRILAAWDQFKTAGPAPTGYGYGTQYEGEAELLAAQSDTFNIYQYGTHGTHVGGIAGGSGAGTKHRGIAYEANFLFVTFLVDEAAVLDGFAWLKEMADKYQKRLVVNMSWSLYYIGSMDDKSLLSQALEEYTNQGVVFVASAGNNGGVNFHIKKEFNNDTLRSLIEFYPYSAHQSMWGQSISMWGEANSSFGAGIEVYSGSKALLAETKMFNTDVDASYVDSFLVIGADTVFYNALIEEAHPLSNRPQIRLRVKNTNTSLRIALKSHAATGTVHYWNVTELSNDVGNWGMAFTALENNWVAGDNLYGVGEPASAEAPISIAAHQAQVTLSNGSLFGGTIAPFSSKGPTIDGRIKPDISAPGVGVVSSVSSFTTNQFTLVENASFNGKNYPFSGFSGTSMSGPAAAGVVALMLQADENIRPSDVKSILIESARNDEITGDLSDTASISWGWGKVDAFEALKKVEQMKKINEKIEPFTLYPNPASNVLYYAGEPGSIYQIELIAITGESVLTGEVSRTQPINVASLVSGLYLVKIEGQVTQLKLIVE